MTLSQDLKTLIDRAQAENDLVQKAHGRIRGVNDAMRYLAEELDYHEACKVALVERLIAVTTPAIAPPAGSVPYEALPRVVQGIINEQGVR